MALEREGENEGVKVERREAGDGGGIGEDSGDVFSGGGGGGEGSEKRVRERIAAAEAEVEVEKRGSWPHGGHFLPNRRERRRRRQQQQHRRKKEGKKERRYRTTVSYQLGCVAGPTCLKENISHTFFFFLFILETFPN